LESLTINNISLPQKKHTKSSIFHQNGTISNKVIDIILDPKIRHEYKTLRNYLKNNQSKITKKEQEKLINIIYSDIYDQLHYFCILSYYIMETNDKWGDAGISQVKSSFCRNLLQISANKPITSSDAIIFSETIKRNIDELGINKLNEEIINNKFEDFQFNLLNHTFTIHEVEKINEILSFIGSNYFIQGGYYGYDKELILGTGTSKKTGPYETIWFEEEIRRTPNTITAMAAVIGNNQIFLRRESLTTIFHQKWRSFIQYLPNKNAYKTNIYHTISDAIKYQALSYYNAHNIASLDACQQTFIQDMGETILQHEIGHGLIQHTILPQQAGSIGESSKICGENILTALLEILADFAPSKNKLKGPIKNIATIANKDPKHASGMFYMYFSDTWFFDTGDEYMYLYSDIMSLLLQSYINPDTTINFQQINKDLQYKSSNIGKQRKFKVINWAIESVIDCTNKIETLVSTALFSIENKTQNFKKTKKDIISELKSTNNIIEEDTCLFQSAFWSNMLDQVITHSDKKQELFNLLEQEQHNIMNSLFIAIAGSDTANKYNFDSRKYVTDQMTKLGLTTIPTP
jgi:hypothetical protein